MSLTSKQIAIELQLANPAWVVPIPVIQFFVAISKPLRGVIRNFLEQQEVMYLTQKATLQSQSTRGDILSEKLRVQIMAVNKVLDTISNSLQIIPLDTVIYQTPGLEEISDDISNFLESLVANVPVKIPEELIQQMGFSNFEFFEGVRSFRDLKNKIEDFEFRSARAAQLSNYASTGIAYIDAQLYNITQYKEILNLLDT